MNRGGDEASQRARAHLRQAAIEGLEATRALLEPAIHTSGLSHLADSSWMGNLQRALEDQGLARVDPRVQECSLEYLPYTLFFCLPFLKEGEDCFKKLSPSQAL